MLAVSRYAFRTPICRVRSHAFNPTGNMNLTLNDAGLIAVSLTCNIVWYVVVHCFVIRLVRPRRLLTVSVGAFLFSTAIFLGFAIYFFGNRFASGSAAAGYSILVLFGSCGFCGLYTFLGPATADRSATAHMLVYLSQCGGTSTPTHIVDAFDAQGFVRKRLVECETARIFAVERETIFLTPRGRRIATVFRLMQKPMRLEELPGYSRLFRAPQFSSNP